MEKEKQNNAKKVCKLINGLFSWRMKVDGQSISFVGSYTAEYFAEHYRKLGYEIIWEDQNINP